MFLNVVVICSTKKLLVQAHTPSEHSINEVIVVVTLIIEATNCKKNRHDASYCHVTQLDDVTPFDHQLDIAQNDSKISKVTGEMATAGQDQTTGDN